MTENLIAAAIVLGLVLICVVTSVWRYWNRTFALMFSDAYMFPIDSIIETHTMKSLARFRVVKVIDEHRVSVRPVRPRLELWRLRNDLCVSWHAAPLLLEIGLQADVPFRQQAFVLEWDRQAPMRFIAGISVASMVMDRFERSTQSATVAMQRLAESFSVRPRP